MLHITTFSLVHSNMSVSRHFAENQTPSESGSDWGFIWANPLSCHDEKHCCVVKACGVIRNALMFVLCGVHFHMNKLQSPPKLRNFESWDFSLIQQILFSHLFIYLFLVSYTPPLLIKARIIRGPNKIHAMRCVDSDDSLLIISFSPLLKNFM